MPLREVFSEFSEAKRRNRLSSALGITEHLSAADVPRIICDAKHFAYLYAGLFVYGGNFFCGTAARQRRRQRVFLAFEFKV
jgi:hypothetical protein